MTRYYSRALLLVLGATVFSAASVKAQIQVAAPQLDCVAGESATASILVDDVSGQNVRGYDFKLTFDNAVARITGASKTNTLSASMTLVPNAKDTVFIVAAASANAISGSGALLNLMVECLDDGVSPLAFHSFKFNAGSPSVALIDGSVGVAAAVPNAEISVSSLDLGEVYLGREVTADLSITNSGTGELSGSLQIIGDDAGAFDLRGTTGTFSLNGGQRLDVTIALASDDIGGKNAQLEITHDAANIESPVLVELTGEVLLNVGTEAQGELPGDYRLSQNYPNPFNPQTSVTFGMPTAGPVRISVYDLTGRQMRVVADGVYAAGWHTVEVSADNLPSGTYIYRLQADGQAVARTMTVLK